MGVVQGIGVQELDEPEERAFSNGVHYFTHQRRKFDNNTPLSEETQSPRPELASDPRISQRYIFTAKGLSS